MSDEMHEVVAFDFNTLTVGDIEDIEAFTEMSFEEFAAQVDKWQAEQRTPPQRISTFLMFISSRHANPDLTLDEIRKWPLASIKTKSVDAPPTDGVESPTNGSAPSAPSLVGAPPPPSAP